MDFFIENYLVSVMNDIPKETVEIFNAARELIVSPPEFIRVEKYSLNDISRKNFVDFPPEMQEAIKKTATELNKAELGTYFEKCYNAAKKYIAVYENYKKVGNVNG